MSVEIIDLHLSCNFYKMGKKMNNSIDAKSIVEASKSQVFADVEGDTVLLNINTGIYSGLNKVGTRVWELIQQPVLVSQIWDIIFDEYDVELERCQDDVIRLLTKLKDAGLIDVNNEKSS